MKSKRGFTLIELLVVIAIIGILSSVVLASLSKARIKARDARRISDFGQIMIALELYYDANGYYPGVHHTRLGTYCATTTPGAQSNDCWDSNIFDLSNLPTTWSGLQTELKPYLAKLPIDPINTPAVDDGTNGSSSCPPYSTSPICYTYAYGGVGRFGTNPISTVVTKPNTYDLVARLEDSSNSQTCGVQDYTFGSGQNNTSVHYYCSHGGTSPAELYDPSPN